MTAKDLSDIWKALTYDPRNMIYPFRYPRQLWMGIYMFNGNRLKKHPSARIYMNGGRIQFGCFWHLWRQRGGLILHEKAALEVHGKVVFGDGVIVEVHDGASLEIGADTTVNPNTRIITLDSIRIGTDCAVSWDVQFLDGDFHYLLDQEGRPQKNSSPIEIGDHVWIGSGVLIKKGTQIGDGAVIASGTVVTGEVPAKSIVAGNPLRVIREGVRWQR